MPDSITRQTINALLPKGSAWTPKPGGGYDLFLDGVADNAEDIRGDLEALAYLRDSALTSIRSDLEKEYGLLGNDALSLSERITRLIAAKSERSGFGADYMQDKLNAYGFDTLSVFINDPPVNPNIFLLIGGTQFNDADAVCGNTNAVFAPVGTALDAELIVNGPLFRESIIPPPVDGVYDIDRAEVEYQIRTGTTYKTVCGDPLSVCGYQEAVFGAVVDWSKYWGLVFFIGDSVTRDAVTDEITSITKADISADRREELRRLIIQLKPAHSWCGLFVNYI